jgi:hypothetical protein
MAQTGYTPILLYSTSTAAAAPVAGNLTNSTLGSELAINITDGKLFYKDNANAIQVIGWKVVPATAGGTGQTSYTQGDLLYATSSTTLGRLADVATGNALISGGVGGDPAWGKIGLTTHVSGVLPTANGGTNLSSFTANGLLYASSTSALATGSVLTFNGTNFAVGGAPGAAKSLVIGPDQTTASVVTSANTDLEVSSTGTSVASGGSLIFGAASGSWKFAAIKALATNGGDNTQGSLSISTRRVSTDAALTESIRFHDSGGISINSGTDPGVGNLSLGTGNLVIGTSGKGIDFSATPGTGTSELLADYEEGTWTPTATGGLTVNSAAYTKVGRQVTITADVTAVSTTSGDISGLPFTNGARNGSGVVGYQTETATVTWGLIIDASSTNMSFRLGATQQQLSTGKRAYFSATYFV